MQDFDKPQKITDFVDALKITEIRDRNYIITFFNGFTGNAYVFRIFKEVFDKMYENRMIIDMKVDIFDPRKDLEAIEKERQQMVV